MTGRSTRLRGWPIASIALVAVVASACVQQSTDPPVDGERGGSHHDGKGRTRPNIVIFVTDDQRDTLRAMPRTRKWFEQGGKRFTEAFATTPLCCPSRASIFSGQYAHNHKVTNNPIPERLEQRSTIQHYLQEAGYQTAIAGKYFNAWKLSTDPAFFDQWAIQRGGYYESRFNEDGKRHEVDRYSTDYIRDRALTSLESFDEDRPWLLYVATAAAHPPFETVRRFADAPVHKWKGNPAVRETNRRDKPVIAQQKAFDRAKSERVESHVFGPNAALEQGRSIRAGQLRTLMSVDRLVDRVLSKVKERGEERETLAFFLSDNGTMWGEHGLIGKRSAYTPSIEIPLLVRWPGHIRPGTTSNRLTANIDIAPTVLDAAGIEPASYYPIDGMSLLQPDRRRRLLLEQWGGGPGTWASIRTRTYQYVEYYAGVKGKRRPPALREYFDLEEDPWQLHNLLGDRRPGNDPKLRRLSKRLAADRRCVGEACP